MTDRNKDAASLAEDAKITLSVLDAVEANSAITQRTVANELGIALGLTNAYLKRCIRKGYIKVRQIPANRYAYYLTPKGFAEKSRLTATYLTMSFDFFRSSREQCSALFDLCADRRWTRVALAGCGDLAEIATLCARDTAGVDIVGIIDTAEPPQGIETFAGLPVVDRLGRLAKVHAVIVTDITSAQRVFDQLCRVVPPDRVLAPPMLKVSTRPPMFIADDDGEDAEDGAEQGGAA